MNKYSLGNIESIGASGKAWVGYYAEDIADIFFSELELATKSIQISSFSTGHQSPEMDKFFNILEDHLVNPVMKINIIINDDGKDKTVTPYARERLGKIKANYEKQFFPQYFEQTKINNLHKILHAKLTVIDGTTALIGSANISKGAMQSNYEIMLKVTGQVAADISKMLSKLSEQIRLGTA